MADGRAWQVGQTAPSSGQRTRTKGGLMYAQGLRAARRVERPRYAWIAITLEIFTAVLAIPVGLIFLSDPTGGSMGLPSGWIEATPFGSYVIPGLCLFAMNGLGMLVLAGLSVMRHWTA